MRTPAGVFFMQQQPFDPVAALEELAQTRKADRGLAQRLRDERRNSVGRTIDQQSGLMTDYNTPDGIPLNPRDMWSAQNMFKSAARGAVQPLNEDFDKADAGYESVLAELLGYKQSQNQLTGTQTKPPTYAEKRAALEEGKVYEELEDGSWGMRDKNFEELSDEEKKSYMETYDQLGVILGDGYDQAMQNLKGSYGGLRLANTPILNTWMKGTTRNAKSALKNILSKYELDASGKMKGQGQISNMERQIIAKAATELSNPEMSEDRAIQLLMEMEMALASKAGLQSKYADSYSKKFGSNAVSSFLGYDNQSPNASPTPAPAPVPVNGYIIVKDE